MHVGLRGKIDMDKYNTIEVIAEQLGCSEKTAESLYATLFGSIQEEIISLVKIQQGPLRFLRMITVSNREYWASVDRGYFISSIYKDSVGGERIYRAIR